MCEKSRMDRCRKVGNRVQNACNLVLSFVRVAALLFIVEAVFVTSVMSLIDDAMMLRHAPRVHLVWRTSRCRSSLKTQIGVAMS